MFCTKCGKNLSDSALFCSGCGAPTQVQPAAQPEQSPEPITSFNAPGAAPSAVPSPPAAYSAPAVPSVPPKKKKTGLIIGFAVGVPVLAVIITLAVAFLPALLVKKTSTAVDAKGGTVQSDDLQVVFEKDSVQEPVNVTLTDTKPTEDKKPDGLLSSLYVMDMDKQCSKPVTIRLKLPQSQSTDSLMIGIGSEELDKDGKTTAVHYQYVDAKVSGGYAEAAIVPSEYATQANLEASQLPFNTIAYAAPQGFRVYVGYFQCIAYYQSGGHFKLYYPGSARIASAEALMKDLESIYQAFLTAGYTYSKRTKWPMDVYVVKMNDLGGYVESGFWNKTTGRSPDHGWIEINKTMFISGYNREQLKPVLGHEWFHFVQANYVGKGSNCAWLDDASATFYEGKIKGATPNIVNEYLSNQFDGVFPANDTPQEGYARAPVVSYMVSKFGFNFLLKTYQAMAQGTKARDAIVNATAAPETWAGDCYQYIVSGKAGDLSPYLMCSNLLKENDAYAAMGAAIELKNPTKEEIDKASAAGDPLIINDGTLDLPPLGARVLALNFDPELVKSFTDGSSVKITVSGARVDMRLFSIIGKNFTVVKAGPNGLVLKDLKKGLSKKTCYMLLLTSLEETSKMTAHISIELVMYPTLDEIVGKYGNGKLTLKDVVVPQSVIDTLTEQSKSGDTTSADALKQIQNLVSQKGSSIDSVFTITKTGTDKGVFMAVQDSSDTPLKLPFTYKNGQLIIKKAKASDTSYMEGSLYAAYGTDNGIVLTGQLQVTLLASNDDPVAKLLSDPNKFKELVTWTASKAPAKKP